MKIVNSNERLDKLQRVGVILRPSTPELKDTYLRLKEIYESYNIEVMIDSISAGMIGVLGVDFESMCKSSDVLVSIGGDGTLISVARRSFCYQKPILAISAGNLGFLTDVSIDDIEGCLINILNDNYRIDERMMIEVQLHRGNEVSIHRSFNDVVMTRKSISKMINIEARTNNKLINTYYGDGMIVSTPTGSTAYNLAANGPVLYPLTEAFIVTPICPHSLTQRPLVLPIDFEIELKSSDEAGSVVILDGQESYELKKSDKIVVKTAINRVKLIHRLERNYFQVLREKLSWGDM